MVASAIPTDAPAPAVTPARLLIVDDHEIVRSGLESILDGDRRVRVVGVAGDGHSARQIARRTVPDVAILDMRLPDGPGDELCARLLELLPSLAVVMLSSYLSEESVRRALDAGAVAYVTKAAGLSALRAALDEVLEGSPSAGPARNAGQIVRRLEQAVGSHGGEPMATPQQARVLELAAQGLTYRDVAQRLFISESTVRFHIQKLKDRLHARSRTELIVRAIRLGIIAPPEDEPGAGA